jgi:hypothetical protein
VKLLSFDEKFREVRQCSSSWDESSILDGMSDDNLVFRSVYVDPDVDNTLRAQAARERVSKGEMFRAYLRKGMRSKRALERVLDANAVLCMRTVYLPALVDEELRVRALALRVSKSDLLRKYLWAGCKAMQPSPERGAGKSPPMGGRK